MLLILIYVFSNSHQIQNVSCGLNFNLESCHTQILRGLHPMEKLGYFWDVDYVMKIQTVCWERES